MPYRPSTVTRDPEATRARTIEETSPAWYNLEVLSSDRPRATSSRLRTSWLKLASGSRDGHRRHAGLNGEGRTRAPSLCGIVVSYLRLGPELYGLPGACMRQAVVSIFIKNGEKTPEQSAIVAAMAATGEKNGENATFWHDCMPLPNYLPVNNPVNYQPKPPTS